MRVDTYSLLFIRHVFKYAVLIKLVMKKLAYPDDPSLE